MATGDEPLHLSRNDNGDALLNTWAIAWVAHQLPRDPLHLFDANIFYPDRYTLGYSEAMLVQGTMALPWVPSRLEIVDESARMMSSSLAVVAGRQGHDAC